MPVTINGTSGITTPGLDASGTNKFATTIGVGNATPSASGAGVTFPATQSNSTDANTLDDYEEGTYTAAFTIISGSTSATYTRQEGKYTKIGNLVYVTFTIAWSANTGAGGLVAVNLPFIPSTNGPHGGFGTVTYAAGLPVNAMLYGDGGNAWGVLIRTNSQNSYYGAGDIGAGGGQIMGGFMFTTA